MKQVKNKIKKTNITALKFLEYAVLIALFLPFAIFVFPEIAGAEATYIVESGSMEPALPTGSAIWIDTIKLSEISEGDVITFEAAGLPRTTHRVIEVRGEGDGLFFKTKGDANEDADTFNVYPGEVVGIVEFSVPYIGSILALAKSLNGFAILIILPAIILIGREMKYIYLEIKSNETVEDHETTYHTLLLGAALIILISSIGAFLLQFLTLKPEYSQAPLYILAAGVLISVGLITITQKFYDQF